TARHFDGPATVHGRFLEHASRAPEATAIEATAIEAAGRAISYGALEAWSSRLAAVLVAAGVGRGDVVAVVLPPGEALAAAVLAILRTGAAFLPLALDDPRPYHQSLVAAAGARAVVAGAGTWDDSEIPLIDPGDPFAMAELPREGSGSADGDDGAYVIFTSGSSGAPKGVLVSHHAIVCYLAWASGAYGLGGPAAVPLHSSVAADLTLTSLLGPLVCGGRIRIVAEANRSLAVRSAAAEPAAMLKLTPSHLEALGEHAGPAPAVLVVGGEALYYRNLVPWLRQRPVPRIINEYGPTEAAVGC